MIAKAIGGLFKSLIIPFVEYFIGAIVTMFWGIVEMGLHLLDNLTRIFEKMAFEKWSSVLFGVSSDDHSVHFFPKSTSPLFYIWITMLSLGILLVIIYVGIYGIKKIKGKQGIIEDNIVADRGGGIFAKSVVVILGMFFVPFMLITGFGISGAVTKMVFPVTQVANNSKIQNFNGIFSQEYSKSSQEIYDFPKDVPLVFDKTSTTQTGLGGLYSHSITNGNTDNDWNDWESASAGITAQPFKTLEKMFKRMKYELLAFSKASLNVSPEEINTLFSNLSSTIEEWTKKWGKHGSTNIKEIFDNLATYSQQARVGSKDITISKEIEKDKKLLKGWLKDTYGLFQGVRDILEKEDNILFIFDKTLITDMDNIQDPLILLKANTPKEMIDTEAIASLVNIKVLANHYLFKRGFSSSDVWDNPYVQAKDTLSSGRGVSLERIAEDNWVLLNGLKIGNGKVISLFDMQSLYSGDISLAITQIIYHIASGYDGKDYSRSPDMFSDMSVVLPKIVLGTLMLVTTLLIMGKLIGKVTWRFAKIGWLWIIGSAIIPTALTDGGGKTKVWISMVMVELISLFALMSMWYVWKHMAYPIADLIHSYGGNKLALDVATFFVLSTFLSLIIEATDWFAQMIGSGDGFSSINTSLRGGRQTGKFIKDRATGKGTRGAFKGIAGKKNLKTGERVGGLLGKNGIKSQFQKFGARLSGGGK